MSGENSLFGAGAGRKDVRIAFTCAGRRVELIQAFQRGARDAGLRPIIHVADQDPLAPAACIADRSHAVPAVGSDQYIPALLKLVRRERIDLLVPLIDNELPVLAESRDKFRQLGCAPMISSPGVIRICRDKIMTNEFLLRHAIDTPKTWRPASLQAKSRHQFPYFLKPRRGSASQGNYMIQNRRDLEILPARVPDAIIQEFISGTEHTLDVYTGFDGKPRCVVPRRRIEVRGGEVTKALTVHNDEIIDTGVRVATVLNECVGLITIQLIRSSAGRISVIEVNPRFGGGVPLSIHAGANFPKWLFMEWQGRRPRIRIDHFRAGVVMLRYHQSFFREDRPSSRR